MVAVAQLVRAPRCGRGGRGFESHQPPHYLRCAETQILRPAVKPYRLLPRHPAAVPSDLPPAGLNVYFATLLGAVRSICLCFFDSWLSGFVRLGHTVHIRNRSFKGGH